MSIISFVKKYEITSLKFNLKETGFTEHGYPFGGTAIVQFTFNKVKHIVTYDGNTYIFYDSWLLNKDATTELKTIIQSHYVDNDFDKHTCKDECEFCQVVKEFQKYRLTFGIKHPLLHNEYSKKFVPFPLIFSDVNT